MVTDVFVWTAGAVYVTDAPDVEERLPVLAGFKAQVISWEGASEGFKEALNGSVSPP
jgi:hypothetical protein